MNRSSIFIAVTLTLSISHHALAGSDTGLYIGGAIGNAEVDFNSFDNIVDDNDTAYKVFGGYNFGLLPTVNFGVEASYADFGSLEGELLGAPARFDNTALQAHLVAGLDLGPVGVFAKAGVSHWTTRFQSIGFSDENSGSDPAYGIGAKLQVESFQLRAEYEQIKLDDADLDFYSIGASYTF